MKNLLFPSGFILALIVFFSTGCENPLTTNPPDASIGSQDSITAVWGQEFELGVESKDSMSYQWYFDGNVLTGETSKNLTYTLFDIGNSEFTVRVTDSKGNSSVQKVSVDVKPPYDLVDVYTVENTNQGDLPGLEVVDVYVNGNDIYAAVNGAGLAMSEDGGETWDYITSESGLFDDYVYSMQVDGSTIYIGHWGGLSVSTDSGDSWEVYDYKGSQIEYEWIKDIESIDGVLFLATLEGVAKSSDNGKTITVLNSENGLPQDSNDREDVEDLAWDGTSLYAACDSKGVYKSDDDGDTWSRVFSSIDGVKHILYEDSRLYIGANDGLYVSSDDGDTWTERFDKGTTFLFSNSD